MMSFKIKRFARYTILLSFLLGYFNICAQGNLIIADERFDQYLPLLQGKRVGLLVNHTSVVKKTHLVDTLISLGIDVKKIYAPEHGFRGKADAGEHVNSEVDQQTGLSIVSLYGSNRKPKHEQLEDVDVVIFDIQDVGVRFYTYISTMHYMMQSCAETGKKFIVLDRPSPLADKVAGPVLDTNFRSFVGMHQIPIVHGLTVGELAIMINKEGWLGKDLNCDLTIIQCENYDRNISFNLPIKPSPNLPNDISVKLYPSLCLLEPTQASIGRGTYQPFQIVGIPVEGVGDYEFTPKSIDGMSKHPKHENVKCYGYDLSLLDFSEAFSLKYLIEFYALYPNKNDFFTSTSFFNKLAGNDVLIQQIKDGKSEEEIFESWQPELNNYKKKRLKYLLY